VEGGRRQGPCSLFSISSPTAIGSYHASPEAWSLYRHAIRIRSCQSYGVTVDLQRRPRPQVELNGSPSPQWLQSEPSALSIFEATRKVHLSGELAARALSERQFGSVSVRTTRTSSPATRHDH